MAEVTDEINELFALPNAPLPQDVLGELQSLVRVHSLSPQELFFKWEAYSLKMGGENSRVDYKTVRDFKKDLQDALERESRGRVHLQSASKRNVNATPRNANTGDVFGVLDSLVTGTPVSKSAAGKRRNNFETPSAKASKVKTTSSPGEQRTPNVESIAKGTSFADRKDPGQIVEQLNGHIPLAEAPAEASTEARVKLKANTEMPKFAYKPMAMKLSEASEILDDRIDEFTDLVRQHHRFPESAFGNPAAESTAEIIAVGRIACDAPEGKLNAASMVLETSRRMGAGLRVPLRMDKQQFDFFPGKIVALKGINASGEYFSVSEVLTLPRLQLPATSPADLEVHNARLSSASDSDDDVPRPLSISIASGPYTTESDLSYDALEEICSKAAGCVADVLILTGPFLDLEHPLIASGDVSLPDDFLSSPDNATMTDVFRALVSPPLHRLIQRVPSMTVILVPSVRDAISKHVSWPQDKFLRRDLGLPRQVLCVTNPIMLSINEVLVGVSSEDVLYEMQRQRVVSSSARFAAGDTLAALSANVIDQRHFFPVFPPLPRRGDDDNSDSSSSAGKGGLSIAASLDISYLKLGDMLNVVPDLLILPSALTPFAKVVDGVMVVNPGFLSKKRGAGTWARVVVKRREVREEEREGEKLLRHEVYERARVDIVRI
ncbi:hypothetical protein AAFC00_000066 [Neodothiora populina]|uniref:DNA polymerase alpha subunit B n=1 Tax=Neodothiora populina TaxID=2781224 RepID=A0ABR3P1M8_9PEZI